MKKISLAILAAFVMLVAPTFVDAASSVNISVSCSNVTVGGNTTCTIRGTSSALSNVEGSISISGGATMTGITAGSGFTAMENTASGNSGSFAYMTLDDKSGSFTIATINIQGTSAGAATLRVSNIKVGTDNASASNTVSNKQTTFTVQSPATQPPVTQPPATNPTTRPTTKPTTKNPTTGVTTNFQEPTTQAPTGAELVLSSVTVDDFEVTYQDGKYFATVNYDTESVEVKATASELITIIGQGTRNLAVGKNVVELVVRNELNQSTTIQVVITRPDDTNDYDTTLSSLKIVGYNIDFDKDRREYTLTVDSSIKELYVIAESNNTDVAITGAGLKTLTKGENEIHVLSQYGNKSSTEYVIYIKRSYNSLIMWIVMGVLGTGLIGSVAYFLMDRKKLLDNNKQEKNKIMAEANRAVVTTQESASINGESTIGIGKSPVAPVAAMPAKTDSVVVPTVEDVKPAIETPTPKPAMVTPKPVVIPQPAAIKQVVKTKAPTNPVAVAQSTVIPKTNQPQNISKTPQQVKVVKTNQQPVKTINTVNTSNNYDNDQIVINTGK